MTKKQKQEELAKALNFLDDLVVLPPNRPKTAVRRGMAYNKLMAFIYGKKEAV